MSNVLALIDADILPYEFGGMVQLEDPDQPLAWEIVRTMVDDRIKQILEATGATTYKLYLTDSSSNFRMELATIKPYKGHRKTEKPYHWDAIRQHLIDNWNAEVQYGIEADDRLGIEQSTNFEMYWADHNEVIPELLNTVICSRDKDLNMIPGWHYVWPAGKQKEQLWFQDELSAIRCFYRQLLTGDSTDNILGLYGVGASSQLVKRMEDFDQEQLMFEHVYKAYQDRFGTYAAQFMWENAALLWIMREEPYVDDLYGHKHPAAEIENRLDSLLARLADE